MDTLLPVLKGRSLEQGVALLPPASSSFWCSRGHSAGEGPCQGLQKAFLGWPQPSPSFLVPFLGPGLGSFCFPESPWPPQNAADGSSLFIPTLCALPPG